jgi:glycosyltransferase involved in cell wall biosynthesis
MRLLIVQYAGDFKEAVENFESGGEETYGAQKYSVDAVLKLASDLEDVAVLCCQTNDTYDTRLNNGLRAIGAGFKEKVCSKRITQIVQEYAPTHLVMRTPIPRVLFWAIRNRVPTIVILADCFPANRWKDRVKNFLLAKCLNHPRIEWVFNHGVNSSQALQDIGVKAQKIVPWDWPPGDRVPDRYAPKSIDQSKRSLSLIFVGMLIESKGIGDLLRAMKELEDRGIVCDLKVAGKGDSNVYRELARELSLEDKVTFLGMVPNQLIMGLMADSDLVIVPSRHEYPEGLPMTIYEAFCSHTPIVASDHPMFRNRLVNEQNAMVFEGGNASALADSIARISRNPGLYEKISAASTQSWQELQIPLKWAQILTHWINNSAEDKSFFADHALSTGRYR